MQLADSKVLRSRTVSGTTIFFRLMQWIPSPYQYVFATCSSTEQTLSKKLASHIWAPLHRDTGSAERAKKALITPLILALSEFSGHINFGTDTCDVQFGGVLLQKKPQDTRIQLGYWSPVQSTVETRKVTTPKECLAIFWSLLLLPFYLEVDWLTIHIAHDSLKWTLNPSVSIGHLEQWRLRLSKLKYDALYRARVKHHAGDALSHLTTTGHSASPFDYDLPLFVTDASTTDSVSKIKTLDAQECEAESMTRW